jgi:hypothetical protein
MLLKCLGRNHDNSPHARARTGSTVSVTITGIVLNFAQDFGRFVGPNNEFVSLDVIEYRISTTELPMTRIKIEFGDWVIGIKTIANARIENVKKIDWTDESHWVMEIFGEKKL